MFIVLKNVDSTEVDFVRRYEDEEVAFFDTEVEALEFAHESSGQLRYNPKFKIVELELVNF